MPPLGRLQTRELTGGAIKHEEKARHIAVSVKEEWLGARMVALTLDPQQTGKVSLFRRKPIVDTRQSVRGRAPLTEPSNTSFVEAWVSPVGKYGSARLYTQIGHVIGRVEVLIGAPVVRAAYWNNRLEVIDRGVAHGQSLDALAETLDIVEAAQLEADKAFTTRTQAQIAERSMSGSDLWNMEPDGLG